MYIKCAGKWNSFYLNISFILDIDLIEVQEVQDRQVVLVINYEEDAYQQDHWYWHYYHAPEGYFSDLVWRGYDPTYAIRWMGWDAHWQALRENAVLEVVDAQ